MIQETTRISNSGLSGCFQPSDKKNTPNDALENNPSFLKEISSPVLSLDKITMTLFYPKLSNEHGNIEQRVEDFRRSFAEKFTGLVQSSSVSGFYRCCYQLLSGVNVQFAPMFQIRKKSLDGELYETDNNYTIRLEYNPNHADSVQAVKDFFKWLPDFYWASMIKINRLDIAIDYPIDLNPWGFVVDRCYKSFYAAGQSGTQTIYAGSMNSDHMFRIYNKKIELIEKQKIDYLGKNLWRIELVERESRQLINYQSTLKNFFQRVHLLDCITKKNHSELDMITELSSLRQISPDTVINDFYSSPMAKRRLKKELRTYERTDIVSPAIIFDDQFLQVFTSFRNDFYNYLKSVGKYERAS